jgi:RNA polymerase sigma-70 factor (ECF subfamily)
MKQVDEDNFYNSFRKGDIKAFEHLYKMYQPRLFAYCQNMVYSSDVAKDIVQESFMVFWENRENIHTDFSVISYLFKILHSNCLKYLRRASIMSNFSDLTDLKLKEIEMNYYSPEKNIFNNIYLKDLEKIYANSLDKLPEKCREIFVLSRQQYITSIEIATKLGLSLRTVENQLYRATKILKEELKQYA